MKIPSWGVLALLACIGVYALLGAIIHIRNLPSIVVTLGMSFVWLGAAILVLPTPGGQAPGWLRAIVSVKTTFIPAGNRRKRRHLQVSISSSCAHQPA